MPVRVSLDPSDGIVHLEASGSLTAGDMIGCLQEILGHPGFVPGMPQLCDLSAVDETDITAEDVAQIAEAFGRHTPELADTRLAIVSPKPLLFGLGRMYEALAQGHDFQGAEARVFWDRREGLAWLRSSGASKPGS